MEYGRFKWSWAMLVQSCRQPRTVRRVPHTYRHGRIAMIQHCSVLVERDVPDQPSNAYRHASWFGVLQSEFRNYAACSKRSPTSTFCASHSMKAADTMQLRARIASLGIHPIGHAFLESRRIPVERRLLLLQPPF
eukprot:scaffold139_cov325-Pavlova_lutheri.AAC.66